MKKGQAVAPATMVQDAKDIEAWDFWYLYAVEGLSYPVIAQTKECSVGHAHAMVQAGVRVVGAWKSSENQDAIRNIVVGRLEYMYSHSRKFYEKGNAKHGAIMARVLAQLSKIQGLETIQINHTHTLLAPEVLERVNGVTKQVVSPLIAEKLHLMKPVEAVVVG